MLKPAYFEECQKQGRFVAEEAFEWRQAEASSNIDGGSIRRWRERGGNAFKDWLWESWREMRSSVVLVGVLKPSSEKWKRIIEGGGGRVVITKANLTAEVRAVLDDHVDVKVAVIPDGFKQNKLVTQLCKHQFVCVPSLYVGIVDLCDS